jgi:hypothetical protein
MASICRSTLRLPVQRIGRDRCPSTTVSNVSIHFVALCRHPERTHSLRRLVVTVWSASIDE